MIGYRKFFLAAVALLVMSLPTSAEQTCRQVSSNVTDIGPPLAGPAMCGDYDWCQYADVRGTINGRWWAYWDAEDEVYLWEDENITSLAINIDDVFETNNGDINAKEHGITNFDAFGSYAASIAVTGGTGMYEDATGWMTGTLTFGKKAGGTLAGEICWSGD